MWKAPSALHGSKGCCGQFPITSSMPMALHPSSCNLSCTAMEAAANHAALCADLVLSQNIPTVGCGELLTCVLPCKLMEPGLQPPRAMMSSFNPWKHKVQMLNLLCWESNFVTPAWLLILLVPPSWMTTVGTFHKGENSSAACSLLNNFWPSFWRMRL